MLYLVRGVGESRRIPVVTRTWFDDQWRWRALAAYGRMVPARVCSLVSRELNQIRRSIALQPDWIADGRRGSGMECGEVGVALRNSYTQEGGNEVFREVLEFQKVISLHIFKTHSIHSSTKHPIYHLYQERFLINGPPSGWHFGHG